MTVQEVINKLQEAVSKDPGLADKPLCVYTTLDPDEIGGMEPIELEERYDILYVDDTLDGKGIDLNI